MELTFTTTIPAEQACLSTDVTARTGAGLAVPFGVPSLPSALDGERYLFTGPPDNAEDLIDVVREHESDTVLGRLAKPWDVTKAGLAAVARFFDTTAGRDALTEAHEGARRGFSVGVGDMEFRTLPDGVREVTRWTAAHLGVVRRPAFTDAGMTFSTLAPTPHQEPNMPDQPDIATTVLDLPQIKELTEKINGLPTVADLSQQVADHMGLKQAPAHPLAVFSSATAFYKEFQAATEAKDTDKVNALAAAFAVPDQVTTDNPGVIPPAWRTDIKKRIDKRTPAITAFGRIGLPDAGMDVSWPYLDPELDIDAIIKQQMEEKQELQGVKIKILKDSEPIKTAGAVSDISYQLLMRSSPSYLAAHNEILETAFYRYLEAKFEAQLLAKGTAVEGVAAAPTTTKALRTFLFAQSAKVEDATGSPADVVLVSGDLWELYGGLDGLYNSKYGTQNVDGTASASTLTIDVNGLALKRAPFFPDGTILVGADSAAKASNSGALVATGEDVRRLGRDVAVWGMYTDGEVYLPGGIRVVKVATDPGLTI